MIRPILPIIVLVTSGPTQIPPEAVIPHRLPAKRPDFSLSAVIERMFEYPAPRIQYNELYTNFTYTQLHLFAHRNRILSTWANSPTGAAVKFTSRRSGNCSHFTDRPSARSETSTISPG